MTRFYTVGEANRTLPYVRQIVDEVRRRYRVLRDRGREHNELPRSEERQREALKRTIRGEAERIHECVGELTRIGVSLKDYETGLVDFPARHEGRPIELCWKSGEPEVAFWHERWAGYLGRRPVPRGASAADWPARDAGPRTPPPTDRPPAAGTEPG